MAKFEFTYSVELEEQPNIDTILEAYYWHDKVLRNPEVNLPEHVLWVKTLPEARRVD